MSVQGYYIQQPLRYIGETWNSQNCYSAQDDFFDCLDRENSINVNRKQCAKELNTWKSACPDAERRAQMIYRRIDKQNHALYTAQELQQYNHQLNNKGFN